MAEIDGSGKQRVYELARDLNLSSEALIKVLTEMEITVKSHMSSMDPEQITKVRNRFDLEKKEARTRPFRRRPGSGRRRGDSWKRAFVASAP